MTWRSLIVHYNKLTTINTFLLSGEANLPDSCQKSSLCHFAVPTELHKSVRKESLRIDLHTVTSLLHQNSVSSPLICSHEFSDNLQAIWAGVHGPEEAGTWTVTAVEEDSRRKTYTLIREEGRWRIRKNKEVKDI